MLRVAFVDLVGSNVDVSANIVFLTIENLWQLRFHEETFSWRLPGVWNISCQKRDRKMVQ